MGLDSAAECCNEYPSFCTVPDKQTGIRADLRCLDLVPYESYIRKTMSECAPKGWPQGNNDCWLDSSLYAMFGSRGWRLFSTLLDRMEESGGELTVLATQISNYLRRIDGTVLLDPNCKQQFKNSIALHYIKYFLKHLQIDNEESVKAFCQYQFTVQSGDVGNGDQDVMFRLFQRVAEISSAVPCRFLDFLGYSPEYPTLAKILDRNQHLFENDTEAAIVINLKGITEVSSTSTVVMKRGKFSLVSYVIGNGPHVVARVKCHDSELWQVYDNMNLNTTNGVITRAILPAAVQHITLVYVREQTTLDPKPAPSEAVATLKEADDHGTPIHTVLPSTGTHKLDRRRNGLSPLKKGKHADQRPGMRFDFSHDLGVIATLAIPLL